MRIIFSFFILIFSTHLFAEDVSLTVREVDNDRNRVAMDLLDSSQVPLGTVLRVHTKTGTCKVRMVERVNNSLIGRMEDCEFGIINPGLKLAYTPITEWEPAPQVITKDESPTRFLETLRERLSVYVGHNFSRQLEGKVYANGSVRNLEGDTALSLGLNGKVYDFSPRVSLGVGLGYETPRTLDRATFSAGGDDQTLGTMGYSPRLSLWSLAVQAEVNIIEKLVGFGGINYSLPSLGNSPFSIDGDIGFQAGANYQLYEKISLEALIKISNMDLKNDRGQTTDVSLSGLEIRGRYRF